MIPLGILSQGVYKNVALSSQGTTISLPVGTIEEGNINNIILGYRQVLFSDPDLGDKIISIDPGNTQIDIDLGQLRNIKELNFLHGVDSTLTYIGGVVPNSEAWTSFGLPVSGDLAVYYSPDGVSTFMIPFADLSTNYLFSKNILPSVIQARYIQIVFNGSQTLVCGIELWGNN